MKSPILLLFIFFTFGISLQAQQQTAQTENKPIVKRKDARSVDDLKSNPEEITHVNFSRRNLTSFPLELVKCINIEELTLSFNEIQSIPDGISSLKKLKRLLISNNKISSIPEGLGSLTELEILDISSKPHIVTGKQIGRAHV